MKPKVLMQIDCDENPSSFDSIVAIDSGVDHLLTYGGVEIDQITGLIHGAMFTRGPADLNRTAAFLAAAMWRRQHDCLSGPRAASLGRFGFP